MRRALLLLVACLATAACSGASPTTAPTPSAVITAAPTVAASPTEDPLAALLRDAADATIAKETASFVFAAKFEGSTAVPEGTSLTGNGSFAWLPPKRMTMSADFASLGLGKLTLIVDDQTLYMRGDVLKRVLKTGQWLVVDLTSNDARAVSFRKVVSGQNDPALALYYVYAASGTVADVGAEDIAGAPTHHYSTTLDLDDATDKVPSAIQESFLDNIAGLRVGGIDRRLTADVWVGSDGLVHRVTYVFTLGPVAGGGHLTVTYDFDEFGATLDLGIPGEMHTLRLEDLPRPS